MNQRITAQSSPETRNRTFAAFAALAAICALASACGGAAAASATAPAATGPQSAVGRNVQVANATQARVNAQTVAAAMASCAIENATASNDGVGSCDATQLRSSEPSTAPLLALGAKPGGVVYQPGAGGSSTITAYAAILGATTLRAYTMVRDTNGASRKSCAPPDQTVCPNGAWPGG